MKPLVWRAALGAALVATLLAAYLAPEQAGEGVVLTERAARPAPATPLSGAHPAPGGTPLAVLALAPRGPASAQDFLFDAAQALKSVASAPVAASPALPPAAPPAPPPMPLKMIGRYVEDGKVAAFVQFNEQNLVLRQGDVVADVYKVELISDNALTVRYLPLDQIQTVALNAPN